MGLARILLVASENSLKEIFLSFSGGSFLRGAINPLWAHSDGLIVLMFSYGETFDPIKMVKSISSEWPDVWAKADCVNGDLSFSSKTFAPVINEGEIDSVEIEISPNANLDNIGEVVAGIKNYFGEEFFYEKENWSKFEEYEFDGIRLVKHQAGAADGNGGSSGSYYGWLEQQGEEKQDD
jgi:uncharacterized protein YkuJ